MGWVFSNILCWSFTCDILEFQERVQNVPSKIMLWILFEYVRYMHLIFAFAVIICIACILFLGKCIYNLNWNTWYSQKSALFFSNKLSIYSITRLINLLYWKENPRMLDVCELVAQLSTLPSKIFNCIFILFNYRNSTIK